jgi:hypothetical protein
MEEPSMKFLPVAGLLLLGLMLTAVHAEAPKARLDEATAAAVHGGEAEPAATQPAPASLRTEADLTLGMIRLGLLRAKIRLEQHRYDGAISAARASLAMVNTLPDAVERESLEKPLKLIIAQAQGAKRQAMEQAHTGPAFLTEMGETRTLEDVLGREYPWDEPIDNFTYRGTRGQGHVQETRFRDTLDRFGEDPNIWQRVIIYPDDWIAKSERRKQYRDGILYEGPKFETEDGEVKQTIVYDIRDLLVEAPDFTDAPILDLFTITQALADRTALREASRIFTGTPRDLREGIDLLDYFGGTQESRIPPGQGQQERDDLLILIEQVLDHK